MKQIKINEKDNVAVMLEGKLSGHKIALNDIKKGENIIKYGYPIGHATEDIKKGDHIHTHNIKTNLSGVLEYKYEPQRNEIPKTEKRTFMGYRRADGKVGIRNEIWIVNTVGCVNKTSEILAREADKLYGDMCDGVFNYVHPFGCSQLGDDQKMTQNVLKGLVNHPNATGVFVLGLGCENNNISVFKTVLGEVDENRVKFMSTQDFDDEIGEGLRLIGELAEYAKNQKREECDMSELVVGLKCGGSDGLSGITANPLVGRFSDLLISKGGTTILTEVPEMFGAETILMNRCANEELFHQTVDLINDFKNYFKSHNQTIYENPSPGNKKGGISTLEDKSLGCTQKSGSALVKGVLQYGDTVKTPGLNLLSAPGNDLVAATALAAAGAHIVLFTTGRGTPFASPVPTMKIATNSRLAGKKSNWIDFNAGVLVEDKTMEEETKALFDLVVETASGRQVCSEAAGFHDMAIFKQGVTL